MEPSSKRQHLSALASANKALLARHVEQLFKVVLMDQINSLSLIELYIYFTIKEEYRIGWSWVSTYEEHVWNKLKKMVCGIYTVELNRDLEDTPCGWGPEQNEFQDWNWPGTLLVSDDHKQNVYEPWDE